MRKTSDKLSINTKIKNRDIENNFHFVNINATESVQHLENSGELPPRFRIILWKNERKRERERQERKWKGRNYM